MPRNNETPNVVSYNIWSHELALGSMALQCSEAQHPADVLRLRTAALRWQCQDVPTKGAEVAEISPGSVTSPLTKSFSSPAADGLRPRKRGHTAHSRGFASSYAAGLVAKRLECGAFPRFGLDFVNGPAQRTRANS